jgi:hypothetical protein
MQNKEDLYIKVYNSYDNIIISESKLVDHITDGNSISLNGCKYISAYFYVFVSISIYMYMYI